jgi:hypothetical protein
MKRLGIIALIGIQCVGFTLAAQAAKNEGKPVDIKVEIGKVTEVVFPEKIMKVIKGGQPDSVLVEVLDNSIYLLPKTDTPAGIFVTISSGVSYPLTLQMSQEHDIKVQIGSSNQKEEGVTRGMYSDVMDLMKDLLLEREPSMSTTLPHQGEVFLSDQHIKVTVNQAYEVGDWRAYVLTARNLINQTVIVPVEQMSLPNLLAVSAERDILAAAGQANDSAKVYVIVRQ